VNTIVGRCFLTCLDGTKLSVLAKSVKSNSLSDGGAFGFAILFFEAGFFLLTLLLIIFFISTPTHTRYLVANFTVSK
jgi:hypothetical protein